MREIINNFPKQFEYEPVIVGGHVPLAAKYFVVLGMGGSHLAADLAKQAGAGNLIIHSGYGLPNLPEEIWPAVFVIASSFSGDTEEVLDGAMEALERKLPLGIISQNGKLRDLAEKNNSPRIILPDVDTDPRHALGYSLRALLKMMGNDRDLSVIKRLAESLSPASLEIIGKDLATELNGFIPVIYSTEPNWALAYNWKIKFNETAKIPAFCNTIPEMNHNEIAGLDDLLIRQLLFIFLSDDSDYSRLAERLRLTRELYQRRGAKTKVLKLKNGHDYNEIFNNLLLADWTAFYLAERYDHNPAGSPILDELKRALGELKGQFSRDFQF